MASVKRLDSLLEIFGPDEQIGASERWIHAAGIVRPDDRFDADLIEDALRDVGIGY
jgi:hypothetical protein